MAILSISKQDPQKKSSDKMVMKKNVSHSEPDVDEKDKNAPSDNDSDNKKVKVAIKETPKGFDAAAFDKEIANPKYSNVMDKSGKVKKYAFRTDPKTKNIIYPGSISSHLPLLAEEIKGNLSVLEAAKKKKGSTELTEEESNTELLKAGRKDYATHKANLERQKSIRDRSEYSQEDQTKKVDIGGTYNPRSGGGVSMEKVEPYDTTHLVYSKPLTLKKK